MNKKFYQSPVLIALFVIFLCSSFPRLQADTHKPSSPQTIAPLNNGSLNCGFDGYGAENALNVHRENQWRGKTHLNAMTLPSVARVETRGDVALIEDDGSIIMQPNGFDLKNKSLVFTPDGNGYRLTIGGTQFDDNFGSRINDYSGIDDLPMEGANNGYKEISIASAPFNFFNTAYDKIFIGTNGFVTFNRGDTTARTSAAVLAKELPRLAPLWADLDFTNRGSIFYNRLSDHHLVTWNKAPQAQYAEISTFQLALFDDGRIVFAYKKVKARNALIGLSAGNSASDAAPIDFSAAQNQHLDAPVFESFSVQKRLDIPALTRAFYSAFPDEFDTVYLWTDFAFDNGPGYATSFVVRNDIQGIGIRQFDKGNPYGSASRLSSIVVMGDVVRSWIDDPNANMVGLFSAVAITCHEQAHRWTSYIRFNTNRGVKDDLLGRDLNHWSFFMDTRTNDSGSFSSLMEGNAWSDGTAGTFRTLETSANYFSELDQYLMGLRSADEVRDLAYIEVSDAQLKEALRIVSPAANFSITGERKTVSLNQVIAYEGERVPDAAIAPKEFRIAFILLSERGNPPTNATIDKTDRYRSALVRYFSQATDRRGALNSSLSAE
ncbi:MAG: hypothetical protein AB1757_27415 [Acidobacteriota bacterium]